MQFDPQLWRERAWKALKKAHTNGKDKAKIESEWATSFLAIGDMAKVIDWCTTRGIKVDFVKKAAAVYYPDSKLVKIASKLKPLRQLAYLLHECGHHLIDSKEDHERFGMGYPQDDPNVKRTFHHRITCLEEELEAWHRGWKLAQRLNLNISREKYDVFRLECLRTYIKWTLKPGRTVEEKDEEEEDENV